MSRRTKTAAEVVELPGAKEAERYNPLEELKNLRELAKEYGVEIPLKTGFTPDHINAVMPLLRSPLPDIALQSTSGRETGKKYDTTGYSYQAHIDRMNWVFGPTHWRWRIDNEMVEEGRTSNNRIKYTYYGDICVEIGYQDRVDEDHYWQWTTVWEIPPYPTDHENLERGSAKKGMLTKGLKRATSTLGVGADAWLGALDDDLITGAMEGESMDGSAPARRVTGPEDGIGERDFDYLAKTAQRKGFTLESLRKWIAGRTEGELDKPAAEYTNAEFERAKQLLFTIPQGKTIQDFEPEGDISRRTQRERPRDKEKEPEGEASADSSDGPEIGTSQMPNNLEELIGMPDDFIRELAKSNNFNMPSTINDKNRRPLCTALAALAGIPAK